MAHVGVQAKKLRLGKGHSAHVYRGMDDRQTNHMIAKPFILFWDTELRVGSYVIVRHSLTVIDDQAQHTRCCLENVLNVSPCSLH